MEWTLKVKAPPVKKHIWSFVAHDHGEYVSLKKEDFEKIVKLLKVSVKE